MELKRMMEKLGQAKTHLELKKMIAEVDTTNSGAVVQYISEYEDITSSNRGGR
jgi:Ca2+-binding EF-hand superfamily protein